MLDLKYIRENCEKVKSRLAMRSKSYNAEIDRMIELDEKRRSLIFSTEQLKAEQNKVSKEIPALKKNGQDTTAVFAEMKKIADQIKEYDSELNTLQTELNSILMTVPNVPADKVPEGKDSDDNIEMRKIGEVPKFDFEPKPHWEIGEGLNILDPASAAKVTGTRFHFYKGVGARLERAVINYFLDTHTKHGYMEILPPFLANTASMTGTGQLPKFAEDMFHVEGTDLYLIPTAEVPVTNLHRSEILDGSKLTIKYCAYSACFRGEAGSAGRDTRGLIRQHQFNKVELVKFADPEKSYEELELLTNDAERVLQGLGLPYRVVILCTGDLGFSSACTYDIEVWMPSYGRYVEISSCSNFEDFQARRAEIRFKKDAASKPQLVHTLNGSGVAVGRTVACILENYQNADGSVRVPEALKPYMSGIDVIR